MITSVVLVFMTSFIIGLLVTEALGWMFAVQPSDEPRASHTWDDERPPTREKT